MKYFGLCRLQIKDFEDTVKKYLSSNVAHQVT